MAHAAKWFVTIAAATAASLTALAWDDVQAGTRHGATAEEPAGEGRPAEGPRGPGPRPDHPRALQPARPGPTTEPASTQPARPGMDNRPRRGGRWGSNIDWQNVPDPSAEEWAEVEQFLAGNSPKRLELYNRMKATLREQDGRRLITAQKRMVASYQELNRMQEREPELYEFAFRQFQIEDQILSTLSEIREKGETAELGGALRAQVGEFVENLLKEREMRIKRVREFLKQEEAGLAKDRANLDGMVERQRNRFENQMRSLLEFEYDAKDATSPATRPAHPGR